MKKLFLILIIVPFVFSCTKSNTRLYGKITNECNGAPVAGVKVELWTGERNNGSRHRALKDTMRTFSDGSFDFLFRAQLTDNNYFVQCKSYQSDYVTKKSSQQISIKLPNSGQLPYVDLLSKNTTPYNSSDSIYIDFVRPNSANPTYHMHFIYRGTSVDTLNTIQIDGCAPYVVNLNWAVTKNHVTNYFANSVTANSVGISSYQINY